MISDVQSFTFLNKDDQELKSVDGMVESARERVSFFQKVAQEEVTKTYGKI